MAMDTFIVFAASYDTLGAAEADYHAVREFYLTSGLIDTYDAAVITRDDAGKVKIVVKHEQPTRQGAWRGLGIGLVGGALVALFPAEDPRFAVLIRLDGPEKLYGGVVAAPILKELALELLTYYRVPPSP